MKEYIVHIVIFLTSYLFCWIQNNFVQVKELYCKKTHLYRTNLICHYVYIVYKEIDS